MSGQWRTHLGKSGLFGSLGGLAGDATCIHALCDAEPAIRSFSCRIAVIPNGVHLPDNTSTNSSFLGLSKFLKGIRFVVPWAIPSEERFEPFNAWLVLSLARKNRWWLVFIGFGDGGDLQIN